MKQFVGYWLDGSNGNDIEFIYNLQSNGMLVISSVVEGAENWSECPPTEFDSLEAFKEYWSIWEERKINALIDLMNNYPERFDTESKKAMFVFGQAVQKVRMSVSKADRMKLHEVETPFSVGRVDINKHYMKLYSHVYNLAEINNVDIKELLEYVSMKSIDFKEYDELQFCYALGLTINIDVLSEVYTFAEACKLWGLGESTLRKANLDERFQEGEVRQSGSTWLVTKQAMERLYGKKPVSPDQ